MLGMGQTRCLLFSLKKPDTFRSLCYQVTEFKIPVLGTQFSSSFSTASEKPKEVSVREKIHLQKSIVKKVKRQPFVKNMFCGKIDTDLLAFPEILDKQLLKDIEHCVQSINEVYRSKVDSSIVRAEDNYLESLLSEFKEMGLFGRLVPYEYNGMNLSYSALLRLNEALSLDWSAFTTLAAHEFLATQALLIAGNEHQKAKYLPDFASGKCVGAVCWFENVSGSDLNSICTTAYPSTGSNYFSVTGTKNWVTNGSIADYFIVFVKMPSPSDEKGETISTLIIDKSSDGIVITPESNMNGLSGTGISTVEFKNVQVPHANLIGMIGDGAKILLKILEVCHLGISSFTFGTLKELVDHATEHMINTVRFEKPMTSPPLIRHRLGNIATTVYAMESCAYFTAGLIDSTEDPDCAVECAIVKVFNSEATLFCLKELMKIFGSASILKGHMLEKYYKDAEALESFTETNDLARLFISLVGIRYAGEKKAEFVMKNRNRPFFPFDAAKIVWRQSRIMRNKVSYSQDVAGHLHPSLVNQGNRLEEYVQKLEVLVEHVLTEHGKEVVHHQLDPVILANVAIDLYASVAVLARSSRSYCIGLQNSDAEVRMALAFCNDAYFRIKQHYEKLIQGTYENNNGHYLKIAEQLIDWRGYYAEHPLKYNF